MSEIDDRKKYTEKRIADLLQQLSSSKELVSGKACVYATGSFGRLEASPRSDLDLFIVGKKIGELGQEESSLRNLDALCVKADLINATRKLKVPEFDGDGRYLTHYSSHDFTKTLGTPEDDASNTFTARLLLLLESQPLLGGEVFTDVIEDVVEAYWRDYEDHKEEFIPAFLANDILRLWRTFCVNYEARTERRPEEKKLKGKLKNYKLKHSRLLTCYSALLYLLTIYNRQKTVHPNNAIDMIRLTPIGRLLWLRQQADLAPAHDPISRLLEQYEAFLSSTTNEEELARNLANKEEGYMQSASEFGNTMFKALHLIGDASRFHRVLVV
jgi:predicted nucleotidyltransferase